MILFGSSLINISTSIFSTLFSFQFPVPVVCSLYGVRPISSITHKIESRKYSLYFMFRFAHLIIV